MAKFMKNFGLGLVYIILLPLLLVILAAFALYCLVLGMVMFFQAAIRFFQGLQPLPPFEEDLKVAEIKKAQVENQIHPNGVPSTATDNGPAPQSVYVQNNYYQTPGTTPAPQVPPQPAQNTPFDTTGYVKNSQASQPGALPKQTPPTLDVTSQAIAQQPQPQATPELQKLVQQDPTNSPAPSVIDLSVDDGKDNP
jgi:hypothetical protein